MSTQRSPLNISYETPNSFVRELELSDACEAMCNWMADPDIAKAVNAPTKALSMDDLRRYIAGHDRINGHLLGVFDNRNRELVGVWSVYIDWEYREFMMSVLLPGRIAGDLGGERESGRPLFQIMFIDLDLQVMRGNVVSSNKRMLDRVKAEPEHTSRVPSATGQGHEVIHHYSMTREQYLKIRSERAERDAAWIAERKERLRAKG